MVRGPSMYLCLCFMVVAWGCSGTVPKGAADEVYIAAGTFTMGHDRLPERPACTSAVVNECNSFAPRHQVNLDDFFIDKVEVSIRQYHLCVEAGACAVPSLDSTDQDVRRRYYDPLFLDFPMLGAGYKEASSFCLWKGRRLPTEAEWERAARGDSEREYPWGDEKPTCARVPEACAPATTPGWTTERMRRVGTTPGDSTPDGVLDLYGNARELVADFFRVDYYGGSTKQNPRGAPVPSGTAAEGSSHRVSRGGYFFREPASWSLSTSGSPAWARDTWTNEDGFRCARSLTRDGALPRYQTITWRVVR